MTACATRRAGRSKSCGTNKRRLQRQAHLARYFGFSGRHLLPAFLMRDELFYFQRLRTTLFAWQPVSIAG